MGLVLMKSPSLTQLSSKFDIYESERFALYGDLCLRIVVRVIEGVRYLLTVFQNRLAHEFVLCD